MHRRAAILIGFLSASVCIACGEDSSYQLRGKGLARTADGGLLWTLNAGVLNDSQLPELQRKDVEPVLESAAREASRLLPGMEFRILADQPMNALFLMERTIRAENYLARRTEAEGPVLRLSGDDAARAANRRKLEIAGFPSARADALLDLLARLQETPLEPGGGASGPDKGQPVEVAEIGSGCLHQKPAASAHVWRVYLSQQIRYDLLLTNAFVIEDDLRRYSSATPRGALVPVERPTLLPVPGRTALEGSGALVSWAGRLAPESCLQAADLRRKSREAIRADLIRVLLALALPASAELLERAELPGAIPNGESFPEYAARELDCPDCPRRWELRRKYLGALYDYYTGGGADACRRMSETPAAGIASGEPDGAPALAPRGERLEMIRANRSNLLRQCGLAD